MTGRADFAGRTKYDAARVARYAARSARRDAEEKALLARVLDDTPPPASVLDAPCGTGRIARVFLDAGAAVRAADLSPAMRAAARATLADAGPRGGRVLGIEALDLEAAPPPDAPRHDLVVCLRFLHHLPDAAARARVLASLAARSARHVVLSFHHPVSVHQLARALRRLVTFRRGDRRTIRPATLRREAAAAGLVWERFEALGRWRRELWVARFRVGAGAPVGGALPGPGRVRR